MALKRQRVAREVVGLSRHAATVRQARRRRAIDVGTTDPQRAVESADLVILATPVEMIVPYALRLAPSMPPGSILTDVGSTKVQIVQALQRRLPSQVRFVGAHPLAGSERRGLAAAHRQLFDGSICLLTPTARTDRAALHRVTRLWSAVGARTLCLSPARHDRLLARTSHVSHAVA